MDAGWLDLTHTHAHMHVCKHTYIILLKWDTNIPALSPIIILLWVTKSKMVVM